MVVMRHVHEDIDHAESSNEGTAAIRKLLHVCHGLCRNSKGKQSDTVRNT